MSHRIRPSRGLGIATGPVAEARWSISTFLIRAFLIQAFLVLLSPILEYALSSPSESPARVAHAQAKGDHKLIQMTWMSLDSALDKARRARLGVLLYFPPLGSSEDHVAFTTETLCDQSRSSPMVKVAGEKMAHLRAEYGVPDKAPVVILADWYGNPVKLYAARSFTDRRIQPEELVREVKAMDMAMEAQRLRLDRDLAKAEKEFEKQRYSATVKAMESLLRLKGHPQAEKARDMLEEIELLGREELAAARALTDPTARDERLRRIASDFKGTAVEKEATDALSGAKQ